MYRNLARRIILAVVLCCAPVFLVNNAFAADRPKAPEASDENLLKNGDFEDDFKGWDFLFFKPPLPLKQLTERLAWTERGAQGSRGGLKVTMPPAEKPPTVPWASAAICGWSRPIGPEEALHVSFCAKGEVGGEILALSPWGGFSPGQNQAVVELEKEWKKFEVELKGAWRIIAFALVTDRTRPGDKLHMECEEGTFHLDHVVVTIAENK